VNEHRETPREAETRVAFLGLATHSRALGDRMRSMDVGEVV